jgi:hypothetical protein
LSIDDISVTFTGEFLCAILHCYIMFVSVLISLMGPYQC